eukprot:69644_1
MLKFGFMITNNTYTNIAIYAIIATLILLCITFCVKKCRNKHRKIPHLQQVGTQNTRDLGSEFISVPLDPDITSDPERPSSAYDPNKVAFFNTDLLKIKIKTSDGTIRPFSILSSFTISQAKQMIAKQFNIPVPKQEIIYKKKRCNSISQIGKLNIQNGDILEIIELSDEQIRDQIKITLKRDNMEDITMYCSNLITIRQFKKEVYAKVPVVPIQEQVLCFDDTDLTDMDATLQEYDMNEDCEVVFQWKKVDVIV